MGCGQSDRALRPSAPEAPHIAAVDYGGGVLSLRWTYGELFIDLSHSRMLHWQVLAVGKKGPERGFSVDVSVSAPQAPPTRLHTDLHRGCR